MENHGSRAPESAPVDVETRSSRFARSLLILDAAHGEGVGPTAVAQNQRDNLWGNPNTTTKTPNTARGSKSIYDPCPPGWRVAPQDTIVLVAKVVVPETFDEAPTNGSLRPH